MIAAMIDGTFCVGTVLSDVENGRHGITHLSASKLEIYWTISISV